MLTFFRDIDALPTPEDVLDRLYPLCAEAPDADEMKGRRARFSARAAEVIDSARPFVQAAGVAREVADCGLLQWPAFQGQELLIVGLVTIGRRIDDELRRINNGGIQLEGVFLDAFGSAAVELACDRVDDLIRRDIERRGLKRSCRVSPGHPPFPLDAQRMLFELLPAGELGVELTPLLMMKPVKSVSFVIAAGTAPSLPIAGEKCRGCGVRNCRLRNRSAEVTG